MLGREPGGRGSGALELVFAKREPAGKRGLRAARMMQAMTWAETAKQMKGAVLDAAKSAVREAASVIAAGSSRRGTAHGMEDRGGLSQRSDRRHVRRSDRRQEPEKGYLRGCGIQFGNIGKLCAADPLFVRAYKLAKQRTLVLDNKSDKTCSS